MCPLARNIIAAALMTCVVSGVQAAEPAQKAGSRARESKPLDLKAPDIRTLFTAAQIQDWANPSLPEYIEEVEVLRRRPSWLGRVAWLFAPYTSPTTTNTRLFRVADSTQP